MGPFIIVDFLSLLLLLGLVQQGHMSLFIHLHLHAHLLVLLSLHIPPPLRNNVAGLLPCLINLLVGTVLFLFQKLDPIR
jgi:hypothetical protein